MERDCYQIEVVHLENPHLIWVVVLDKNLDDLAFEQIGIYGLLPYEITIDVEIVSIEEQSCKDWVPAAAATMNEALAHAKEVWFRPTYLDRRTSIFDDNVHKYGEIIVMTHDNKKVMLSEFLINSRFAIPDVKLFHQELIEGKLKTKQSHIQSQQIMLILEKEASQKSIERESLLKKQTTVFQAAQKLESALMVKNTHRHNVRRGTIDNMLEKKCTDFDLCKDIDDESSGRASTRRIGKLSNVEDNKNVEETKLLLLLKKKLENRNSQKSVNSSIRTSKQAFTENHETNSNKLEKMRLMDKDENVPHTLSSSVNSRHRIGKMKDVCGFQNVPTNNNNKKTNIVAKRTKLKSLKDSDYNVATENRVAYGPPGVNATSLPTRIVSMESAALDIDLVSQPEEYYEEPSKTLDMNADVDSDVNISINIRDILKDNVDSNFNNNQSMIKSLESNTLNDLNVKNNTINDSMSAKNKTNDSSIIKNDTYNISDFVENETFNYSSSDSLIYSNITDESNVSPPTAKLTILKKRFKLFQEMKTKKFDGNISSSSDTTNKDSSSDVKSKRTTDFLDTDDESLAELQAKIKLEYPPTTIKSLKDRVNLQNAEKIRIDVKNNVNPFKNIDPSISVFVEKLVSPVLMVHNKMNYPISPCSNIRDVNFNTNIHVVLKNLRVEKPMMLQMISWPVILRGYSLFMIGPMSSGKTFGYLPAVCRLIADNCSSVVNSVGPTCIIVCATAQSVSEVEHYARMLLGVTEKVVSCYAGMDDLHITTSLLNGCDLFICTPSVLVRLLEATDFGVDLRRLSTFVLEDCERLTEVYTAEVKYTLIKIREMLKNRANKELKVQFVVASRVWCDFMEVLAKKSPNSVICISAFQECVLYSKANTSVDFIKKESKVNKVLEFLGEVDTTKKTVIVCRSDDEVEELAKVLTQKRYMVFASNNTMTVEDLYNLSKSWEEYQEPVLGPILVCCDGNLTHLNVTDAHYLVHYSLPHLFSMFCKRFAVLNDNYPSVFKKENESIKIKIFLEDSNAEQLPKILNFIKRCTDKVPEFLDRICENIVLEKEMMKAKKLVPICHSILALGECPDLWNCQERHAIFKEFDEPKNWMPRNGVVTFKILHYHTPTHYSVRLLSNTSNGVTKKYAQTYKSLFLKMGMYFSKESNQKLHGTPKVGDVCAVSVKQNFFVRCQVLKILTWYKNMTPDCVLIKLIDEEKLEKSRDIYLFHLPDELKTIETQVAQVRLANVCPKDKDVTFSDLARDEIKKITADDDDFFMRGKVVLTVGNCVIVDTLEACQELTSMNETVVMHNLRKELLNTHALANPSHVVKMEKICGDFIVLEDTEIKPQPAPIKVIKNKIKPQWAHLENDVTQVFFASTENPGMFFIRLVKFESCMNLLIKDMAKYVADGPAPLERVTIGELVLAKFPDDGVIERARIDDILNESLVKCFFVDQGDWRDVQIKDLTKIPSQYVAQMPFQAIECRLIGVSPVGDDWTEFGTNWFHDACYDANGDPKILYVKYFTKETPEHTDGRKYGVAVIDTCGEKDVVINQLMVDLNLALEKDDEVAYLQELDFTKTRESNDKVAKGNLEDELDDLIDLALPEKTNVLVPLKTIQEPPRTLDNVFLKRPIRSVPLVDSDNESSDSWDIVNTKDLVTILKGVTSLSTQKQDDSKMFKDDSVIFNDPITQSNNGFEFVRKERETDDSSSKQTEVVESSTVRYQECKNAMKNKSEELDIESKVQSNASISKKRTSKNISLDSDDFSSAEGSQLSEKSTETLQATEETTVKIVDRGNAMRPADIHKIDELRKPKLLWRQNKTSVSIKIQLIGVQEYDLKLEDRFLKFDAVCNDVKYGFNFDLYGVVEDIIHSDKGQYILVKFNKVIKKNWLTLTKDGALRKWIVYDVDSIDTSSDEEETPNTLAEVIKELHDKDRDSESDDDFLDDINFENKDFC